MQTEGRTAHDCDNFGRLPYIKIRMERSGVMIFYKKLEHPVLAGLLEA